MPDTHHHTRRMGNDQADKADRTDDGDHDRRHQRGNGDQHDIDAAHRNTERGGRFRAEGEGVEGAGMPEADDKAENGDRQCQPDIRPSHAREIAEQPEHDAARLFSACSLGNDEGGERVEELRACDAGKDDRAGAASRAHGERADEAESNQRAEKCAGGQRQCAGADAEDRHADRAGRSAGRDAENIGVGERVAQKRLQNDAAQRQCRAAAGCDDRAAQPIVPDDALIYGIQRIAGVPEAIGHRLGHHVERYRCFADGSPDAEREKHKDERRKSGARPKQNGAIGAHFARPAFSMASARRSMPSIVRIVGFIACASMSKT